MKPLPEHEFLPWQSLVAVLHALCPLQAFAPRHLICAAPLAGLGESPALSMLAVTVSATAVASIAPAILVFFIAEISCQVYESSGASDEMKENQHADK